METIVCKISETAEQVWLKEAGEILAAGGLVGIPTETVYGLAANALDAEAAAKIYAAKGR
ncbi:MAG TPA: threonylcarbamoyl-AMP synthase, partial [Lachnospiraceae bacterium]|nr:threonylcarbamoyl-AMP synthase [Lachnospiraceae bacterium]